MPWSTNSDIHRFLEAAGGFLGSRPVEHTVLLTEAAYLEARPDPGSDQMYGWWHEDGGEVRGAFIQAPRHAPVISDLPTEAIDSLIDVLPDPSRIGVTGRLVGPIVAVWQRNAGVELAPQSRITLYRLGRLRHPPLPRGHPRVALPSDRVLLAAWYEQLMAAFPDDPSDLAYVVDDPLSYGGIVLWEVDGEPVAMAGRSRQLSGMVRLGAVYEPEPGAGYGDAAFVAACEAAQGLAHHILAFTEASDTAATTAHQQLGFEPILDRVMLAATGQAAASRGHSQ